MNIHEKYMKKHGLKESDFDSMPMLWNALISVQEIIDDYEGKAENLPIADVLNRKIMTKKENNMRKLGK